MRIIIGYFWKSGKIWNCRLLQIIGGAFRVKQDTGDEQRKSADCSVDVINANTYIRLNDVTKQTGA